MESFDQFIDVVKTLRAPGGCPWDQKQTFSSLIPHIIEEAYELTDAMKTGPNDHLKEELGDVLLHVVMLSNMAEEQQAFSIKDVTEGVMAKMVRRHPHVFGDQKVDSVDEVWHNWEKIKETESPQSTMASVAPSLPALMQAHKIQKRAARLGFDWEHVKGAQDKLHEELIEFEEAINQTPKNTDAILDEAGDVLFSFVNILRKLDIDPEDALKQCNQKFMSRFNMMESLSSDKFQKPFSSLSLDEMETLWEESKLQLNKVDN
ncbi:nucleoside triphosphate pyrophosphohydrolase [Candidatus Marinamargulisbacteria bacterium SCGC AG-410-N11]|nr:nucleoside triphosphate pyrophosphohydrolase [Candidatus Marinamargulisbacteria bacterium SCGC AG-410-N11]